MAFNVASEQQRAGIWSRIDADTEVLVTHCPPAGILDQVYEESKGCAALKARVAQLSKLKLHVFGHIHEGYGTLQPGAAPCFVNASICDANHRPANAPIVVTARHNAPWLVTSGG